MTMWKDTTIWKLELRTGRQDVMMPEGAMIMAAREQNGALFIWFRCDPSRPSEARTLEVFLTGSYIAPVKDNEAQRFVDTVMMHDGSFVVHVFEVLKSPPMPLTTDVAPGEDQGFPTAGNA